jgi:hypothetical protein
LEEADFFHEICLISLYASRAVKFAAVVDSKGKLILAKFKKFHIHSHRVSLLSAPKIQQQDQTLLQQFCYSFCYEHLMPTLNDITNRSYREQYPNKAHFEITEIDKKIGLTESRDKYLCLYLELPPEMRVDGHQQLISKLTNVIQ